ncbi:MULTISPECIES: hypothetical protein [Pseudomonas]|nr:hypothetical protein [Pseudomonas koreensis]
MLESLLPFLDRTSRSPCAIKSAVADNCRFEERTSQKRWQNFADCLPEMNHGDLTYEDWLEGSFLYTQKYLTVPSVSVPEALLEVNSSAWLKDPAPGQTLVRLEALEWPLSSLWNMSLDEFMALNDAPERNQDARRALSTCFDDWNRARDNRPLFAAFLDEVEDEVENEDWSHLLRDRLGLGHYAPGKGQKIPVVLMRYDLQDVIETQTRKGLAASCALPTALDGGMHEYFFPVPEQNPFGATLHLDPRYADLLTAEIIHCRIDYQPRHVWKFGWIEKDHFLSMVDQRDRDAKLREARDLHLFQLRIDSKRDSFAEEMVGRK